MFQVEYSGGFDVFNPQRFGQQFVEFVANPKDILLFHRKKTTIATDKRNKNSMDPVALDIAIPERLDMLKVEDLVQEFLNVQNLDILPENELGDAVRMFVDKDDKDAIKV